MSIYAPPSNIQSVFNPSNYGGLGVDGQITTNYLDANYVQFPVVQGNMTLVGTNILGDVTQQGDLTTTGDITGETIEGTSFLVGTTNLLTEIGTKQDTINDGDLTIAKTDGLQTALDNKYDDTGGTISGNVDISGDLVTNGQLDCDLDAFHYSAADTVLIKGTGADVSWTLTRRGSTIQNGDSFRPKYTGKYSITLCIFFGTGSSGQVKVSLKLNGSEYNLNGGSFGTNLISANDANDSGNILSGNMIVDAVAGQDIKAYVYIGTLRYYGGVSYLAGYYIGNT